jgi:hypothetical protein
MMKELFEKSSGKIPSGIANPKNLAIGAVIVLILIFGAVFLFNTGPSDDAEDKPTVKIGKSYEIIARTKDKKRTTGRFNLTVTNAQFSDSILVQGKRARPVKGKTFLVLNMEIENSHKVQLYAFPADLFRFEREDGKKFAPSVHQGTVLVRPQATKKNNVAFVVLPSEKKFKIEVGDVGETKETLEITF